MDIENLSRFNGKPFQDRFVLGGKLIDLDSRNQFSQILRLLEHNGKPATDKAYGHHIVGLLSQFVSPELAFSKAVYPANDTNRVIGQIQQFLENNPQESVGIATCYKEGLKAMGKAPFWFGRRGGITDTHSLQRFIYGESEDNGFWNITDEERLAYPWLRLGYLNTLKTDRFPIVESIVTSHPPGYDTDRSNHFVGRIWMDSHHTIQMEIRLGTTFLRDLNEQTSQRDIIILQMDHGKVNIGTNYIVEEILNDDVGKRALKLIYLIQSSKQISPEIFEQIAGLIQEFTKDYQEVIKFIPLAYLLDAYLRGVMEGIQLGQNFNYSEVLKKISGEGYRLIEELQKNHPKQYAKLIKTYTNEKIKNCVQCLQQTFLAENSLFLLKDLFDVITPLGFSQVEIIGGKKPNGHAYSKIYEIS